MKKLLSILLLCFYFSATAQNWDQLGQDINGVFNNDNFGKVISINDAGNIIAVGSSSTHVKVYEFDGINWVQLGQTIYTESWDTYAGSISLNADGNILSVGIPENSSTYNNAGCVKVFELNNNLWSQIGSSIFGSGVGDRLGSCVSLDSIGSLMAISASGYIKMYENINNTWLQVGNSINAGSSDKIALSSDGSRVVLLSLSQSKIITWDDNTSTWISNAVNFNPGNDSFDEASLSISNDASIIAIGNPRAEASPQNPNSEGNAVVYKWDGTSLIQLGEAILPNDFYEYSFGQSISLSNNGEIVAIGTHQNNHDGYWSGRVAIYEFIQNSWSQIGQSIYGSSGSYFGYSISINGDGTTVSVGVTNNENSDPGYVRAYQSVTYGCMDSSAVNYNSNADIDDGSCIESIFGCLNETYVEYNSYANLDDGSCEILLSDAYSELTQENINLNNTLEEATTSLSSLQQALDTWNTTIDLNEGWNMFGYGCPSSIDLDDGLSNHTDKITIVKNNNGNVYMPEFGFNGIGDFTPGFGYQIKLTEAIEGFSLCDWYVNDIPEDNIVSLQDSLALINSQIGCSDTLACNYDINKLYNDGSCDFAEQGFDCEGNIIAEIGDIMEGGYLFYIDETGQHGLVAALTDLDEQYSWGCESWGVNYDTIVNYNTETTIGSGYQNSVKITENCLERPIAASAALEYDYQGYSDWYLPSIDELELMYNNLGYPEGNIAGFEGDYINVEVQGGEIVTLSPYYWSSSENTGWPSWLAMHFNFDTEATLNSSGANNKSSFAYIRPIRSF